MLLRNITTTEWEAKRDVLAQALATQWPRAHDGKLRVQTPVLSAHADLRLDPSSDCRAFVVEITVDSSGCISGGALDIANAARMICEVRDAMLFLHGETADLLVWDDGECPCSHCSGKGASRGRTCERCDGEGKR
jgi:hypothetical protein